jgi:hypothetical protein
MSVLQRDLSAYRDAVEQYTRNVRSYNSGVNAYNNSLVTNDQGFVYVTDGSHVFAIDPATGKGKEAKLPTGMQLNQLGRTALPDDPETKSNESTYSFLRQNPTVQQNQQITATYRDNSQTPFAGASGYYYNNKPIDTKVYSLVQEIPGQQTPNPAYNPKNPFMSGPQYITGPKTAIYSADASIYPDQPGDQPTLSYKAPDPTKAALRRSTDPGLADVERGGLINDVIRGNGLAY